MSVSRWSIVYVCVFVMYIRFVVYFFYNSLSFFSFSSLFSVVESKVFATALVVFCQQSAHVSYFISFFCCRCFIINCFCFVWRQVDTLSKEILPAQRNAIVTEKVFLKWVVLRLFLQKCHLYSLPLVQRAIFSLDELMVHKIVIDS